MINKEMERELSQHEEFIKETVRLAEQKSSNGWNRELSEYLDNLDYETIKVLQTIMYIGRDSTYMQNDGSYSYEYARKSLDGQGWHDDKTIEANQIAGKTPLGKYLRKGCSKIELNIF